MMKKIRDAEKGQGLVEFALVFPIFLFMFLAMIDYGRVGVADNQITNAAQQATKEFAHLADTPKYREWYVEDMDKADEQKRINKDLGQLVSENVDTVNDKDMKVIAKRTVNKDGELGDKVSVAIEADLPSITGFSFQNLQIKRQSMMRVTK